MAFRTSILLPIPDAEPLVGPLRHLYDPADAAGVGAHVTLLFPFVPAPQLDANVIADVATMFGKNRPLDLIFDRVAQFPDVAYLALADETPILALIRELQNRWPEYPLYEGKFPAVVPHLTVAHGDSSICAAVAAQLTLKLPLVTTVTYAALYTESADSIWSERARFPL
jgi:2'-5' RNA ligase